MRIFVINLEVSRERRVFMEQQFAALGMAAEFFPAVDGRQLPEAEVARLSDSKWFRRYVGREMSRAELGCSLSHIYLYRKMIEENLPYALILEDDAWLAPSFVPLLRELEHDIEKIPCDVVLFSECRTSPKTIWRRGYYFMSPVVSAVFAHAYVITLHGARRLVDLLFPVVLPADAWTWLRRHHVIRIASIHPVLAIQNQPVTMAAELCGNRALPAKFSVVWFKHKACRAFWKLFDAWVPFHWHRNLK